MNKDLEIHPAQARILRELLFKPKAHFAELNVLALTTDLFAFHLRSLVEVGLLEKKDDGCYCLTSEGKEFANRFDAEQKDIRPEKQAKIGVVVVCARINKGKKQYLVQQRLKQPYFGFHGFVTGKIKLGETIYETAERELQEEAGMTAKLTFKGVEHKLDYFPDGNMTEDKFFYIFLAEKTKGDLIKEFEGGKNLWLTKKELFSGLKIFGDINDIFEILEQKRFAFIEKKFEVKEY